MNLRREAATMTKPPKPKQRRVRCWMVSGRLGHLMFMVFSAKDASFYRDGLHTITPGHFAPEAKATRKKGKRNGK